MRTAEFSNGIDQKTLILVGKTGNGISATGNSVIGRKVFESKLSLAAVTSICQLESATLDDGRIINVIDTPGLQIYRIALLCNFSCFRLRSFLPDFNFAGLFGPSVEPHAVAKEIANCLTLAKNGIHAVLLVLSLTRFSPEEMSAFLGLQRIFGDKIADYMIVLFTHGDVLEDQSLDDFLSGATENLKRTLEMCGNRRVVFDNKTKDDVTIFLQREELLCLVDDVVDKNGGMPYSNQPFDFKSEDWTPIKNVASSQEGFEQFIGMVESRLMESVNGLEKKLEEERAGRLKSKETVQILEDALKSVELESNARVKLAQLKSKEVMNNHKKRLSRAENRSREWDEAPHYSLNCSIL